MKPKTSERVSVESISRQSDYTVSGLDCGNANSVVWFSGKYRDTIFGDDMIQYATEARHHEVDLVQTYTINSSGHRGPEFVENVDLLYAGCSFTYGMGVPEDGIWGSIIANSLGLTYNNISRNGASIPWIIRELFAYFKQYGNPKKLICLFPNLTRVFFTSNPEILGLGSNFPEKFTADLDDKKCISNIDIANTADLDSRPAYSKKPHAVEDVMSIDMVVQIAMQNIRMLEQYCRATGIELLWSTWNGSFSKLIEEQKLSEIYDFDYYVSMEEDHWIRKTTPTYLDRFYKNISDLRTCKDTHGLADCECFTNCHAEYADRYGESFNLGTDTGKARGRAHDGVHRHLHYAELFIDRLKKDI